MKRHNPLKRGGRMSPTSRKRVKLMRERRKAVAQVFQRDHYICRAVGMGAGECFGPLTAHELISRSRSGRDDNLLKIDGMITLCAFHNTWCEDNPAKALAFGLTKHSWEADK